MTDGFQICLSKTINTCLLFKQKTSQQNKTAFMEEPCRQHSPLSCFKELKNAVINLCASPIPSYQQEHYAHSPNYWKITGKKLLCSSESLNMYIIISIKNAWHKIIQTLHTCNIYSNNEADKMQRLRLTGWQEFMASWARVWFLDEIVWRAVVMSGLLTVQTHQRLFCLCVHCTH